MRIITRPDFDGVVCAVLLRDALNITKPIVWIEPYEITHRANEIKKGDIIANLPYVKTCSLWFDHHISNRTDLDFEGAFETAPSAAGIIYKYYRSRFLRDYSELVEETDKIDSADFTADEILNPKKYPYSLLSMTIPSRQEGDEPYLEKIISLLMTTGINEIMEYAEVKTRANAVLERDMNYSKYLTEHTSDEERVAVTDFRPLETVPKGNRFLIYSLFPEILVDMKIRYDKIDREKVIVSLGQNIFNRKSCVNLGELVSRYGGGGHCGAGSCSFHVDSAEKYILEMIDVLKNDRMS